MADGIETRKYANAYFEITIVRHGCAAFTFGDRGSTPEILGIVDAGSDLEKVDRLPWDEVSVILLRF
jgi:hypothetical protein